MSPTNRNCGARRTPSPRPLSPAHAPVYISLHAKVSAPIDDPVLVRSSFCGLVAALEYMHSQVRVGRRAWAREEQCSHEQGFRSFISPLTRALLSSSFIMRTNVRPAGCCSS